MTPDDIIVLLIEDNPADARLIELTLDSVRSGRFTINIVNNLEAALKRLEAETFDIILSDLSLPDAAGLESINLLTTAAPDVPVVVVTGSEDEDTGLHALRAGAQDYLVKDHLSGELLPRAIRYAIERKHTERRLAEMAQFDTLTGLANRVQFREFLNKAVARADRQQRSVALMFVDLDRFKMVNDSHGQETGDKVLQDVAERLTGCLRRSDLIARIGADEFAVVMDSIEGPQIVTRAAKRILDAISRPFVMDSKQIHVTTSIGAALYPIDADSTESLLSSAHTAMARAKENGKNTYQFYTMDMHIRVSKNLELERTLRGALEREEFQLHYQPQVDMRQGKIIGFEGLMRWEHPERGMVPPGEFIDFCEESGLILPLGEWAMLSACKQQKKWQEAGFPAFHIAVNVSPRQLQDPSLAKTFRSIVEQTGAEPRQLDIEMTENAIQKDPEMVGTLLQEFANMGFGIALDDFGTGYSSLTHLRSYPVTTIKIDRSFIANLGVRPDDTAIVTAIVGMAQSLRLRSLAEGIETSEQLALLRKLNCDAMQGYYFSKPLPVEAIDISIFDRNLYDLEPQAPAKATGSD